MKKQPDIKSDIFVFFDVDGVLADFENHLQATGKVTPAGKTDYAALDYDWWVSMPAFPGAKAFYDEIKALSWTKFLTGPVPGADCFGGKAQWVENFVPERGRWATLDLIICPKKDKAFLAGPRRILVDDNEDNIKAWVAAGGVGVHHKGDLAQTAAEVKKAIAGLQQSNPSPAKPAARTKHRPS